MLQSRVQERGACISGGRHVPRRSHLATPLQGQGETVAFLSSTHRTDVTGTIQRMLDDLEALIASGQRIARLVLKEHPGTESTDYRTLVRERCDRWRTELHACDKHQDLSDLQDTVDIALVQDSLTSHWRCGGTALSPSCTARAGDWVKIVTSSSSQPIRIARLAIS